MNILIYISANISAELKNMCRSGWEKFVHLKFLCMLPNLEKYNFRDGGFLMLILFSQWIHCDLKKIF